ncbi:serine/threonine-protein kinase [Oscillatoria sp. FACHB-1406]|uniref:serine/threonine-protein kinase n=1 Tax=Oscillatoria sp. FACHB-1406 TaxID=2692846 RepID=UPI0016833462|nr:serine/threonine-protein kinase [Oscillatoria sp. FACHB-1406]MBD2579516.1 serine/threonine protein kinase [Oscillatoria sp. FACHB-1406]
MYCINPTCPSPKSSARARFCQNCGAELQKPYIFRDRYRVLDILGQGGFGRTYKAQDLEFEKRFYVIKKLIAPETLEQCAQLQPQVRQEMLKKAIECFKREIQQLASLNHPQIPHFYEHFEINGSPYLVQEFIDGDNLLIECQKNGSFSEAQVKELLESLLPVLEYLHSYRVLHRDIKPENIMRRRHISGLSQFVLIDFGGAKEKAQSSFGLAGTAFYSPGYASPEHTTGQHQQTSDIYSLGATCVRLLTVSFPWESEENQIFLNKENRWLWQQVLAAQNRSVSDDLAYIFDKMLRWSPAERYQSAAEVLEALHRLSFAQVGTINSVENSALNASVSSLKTLHLQSQPPPVKASSSPPVVSNPQEMKEIKLAERDRKLAQKSLWIAGILTVGGNFMGYIYTGRYKALLLSYLMLACAVIFLSVNDLSLKDIVQYYLIATAIENTRAISKAKKRNFKRMQSKFSQPSTSLKVELLKYIKSKRGVLLSDLVIETGLEVQEIQRILDELKRDNLVRQYYRFTDGALAYRVI